MYTVSSDNVEANRRYVAVMSTLSEGRETKGKFTR